MTYMYSHWVMYMIHCLLACPGSEMTVNVVFIASLQESILASLHQTQSNPNLRPSA